MTDARVRLAGEDVLLLPERALFWPRAGTLIAADFHWGKGATFRAAGIPIPGGATRDDLERLDAALLRTCARRLIVLGDLFHARAGRIATRTLSELRRWRNERAELEIMLVRGNHDRHAGDPPDDLRINCINAPSFVPPFVLRHEPDGTAGRYTLSGHLHPGVVLAGPGLQRERLPCFWLTPRTTILPAFGGFTGLAIVTPAPEDRVFVIADDEVVPVVLRG
ncbi:MAG TPA: ligase-associated DNA damage response endonuclease PdeM [Gemmatimonadales bacterium]|nr:ligase-associated DNA damage response endonuclease PdeM [Gemmatimonadales bacterium]